jgi:hypothetical protein
VSSPKLVQAPTAMATSAEIGAKARSRNDNRTFAA